MVGFMQPRIQYERQMREPIKQERVAPYRVITGEMLTELFKDAGIGQSYSNTIIHLPENAKLLTRWCGADGMYIVDDKMHKFFEKYNLRYKW